MTLRRKNASTLNFNMIEKLRVLNSTMIWNWCCNTLLSPFRDSPCQFLYGLVRHRIVFDTTVAHKREGRIFSVLNPYRKVSAKTPLMTTMIISYWSMKFNVWPKKQKWNHSGILLRYYPLKSWLPKHDKIWN